MLSPVFATLFSFVFIGEPWRLPEAAATAVSLVGVTLVARPEFIFGGDVSLDPVGVAFGLIASVCAGEFEI